MFVLLSSWGFEKPTPCSLFHTIFSIVLAGILTIPPIVHLIVVVVVFFLLDIAILTTGTVRLGISPQFLLPFHILFLRFSSLLLLLPPLRPFGLQFLLLSLSLLYKFVPHDPPLTHPLLHFHHAHLQPRP